MGKIHLSRTTKICVVAIFLFLAIIGYVFFFPQGNKTYKEYEAYGKGYDAAIEGKTQPAFWAEKPEKEGYEQGLKDLRSGEDNLAGVGFKYTEEEIKSLQALSKEVSSFEGLVNKAINGNHEAMFLVGLSYLYGKKDLPIDTYAANVFFSKAASLGYAPALEKIREKYLEEESPFLHQVYLSLVIAAGHDEFTSEYHRVRIAWIKKFNKIGGDGTGLVRKIEKLADIKNMEIYENKKTLDTSKKNHDTNCFFTKIRSITLLDQQYDMRFWLSATEDSYSDPKN